MITKFLPLLFLPFGLSSDPFDVDKTIQIEGNKVNEKGMPNTRAGSSCRREENIYQDCLDTLSSSDARQCVNCVNSKQPDGDVRCTVWYEHACDSPFECSRCGVCKQEIADYLVCIGENNGCNEHECEASIDFDPNPNCPGGTHTECMEICDIEC